MRSRHDVIDHAAHDLVDQPPAAPARDTRPSRHRTARRNSGTCRKLLERDQAGAQAVVEIVVVVGDLVGEIGDLRFERRLPALDEALAQLAELRARC